MEEQIKDFRLAVDRDFCKITEDSLVEGLIMQLFNFADI